MVFGMLWMCMYHIGSQFSSFIWTHRPIVSAIRSPTYALAKYVARLLQPHIGNSSTFIDSLCWKIEDPKTSTRWHPCEFRCSVPIYYDPSQGDPWAYKANISGSITTLLHHMLTTTYFQWNNTFHEQIDDVAMVSPLTHIIINFYMEFFETTALDSSPLKPKCWFHCGRHFCCLESWIWSTVSISASPQFHSRSHSIHLDSKILN